MPTPDPHKLIARIVADATDERLDDAAFRARAQRAAHQLQRALAQSVAPSAARAAGATGRKRRAVDSQRPAYRYIAVPDGAGGLSSVSLAIATFEELAAALGDSKQVIALAKKVAIGHKPASGMSRSAYVAKRLRQLAACAAR